MSRAASLWLRIAVGTLLALVLLVAVRPARPAAAIPVPAAIGFGMASGLALQLAAARRLPRLRPSLRSPGHSVVRLGLFGLLAANEEVVWRRTLLGELLHTGPTAAIAASTLAFALAHRVRPALHLGTGAAFGGLYVITGALPASIAAHSTYNVLVGTLAERTPRPFEGRVR
jgi:membrane protease YdiL (CAAX protease family)